MAEEFWAYLIKKHGQKLHDGVWLYKTLMAIETSPVPTIFEWRGNEWEKVVFNEHYGIYTAHVAGKTWKVWNVYDVWLELIKLEEYREEQDGSETVYLVFLR